MNQKQRAKWEQTRAKGMWRFVLFSGVLLWGGLMIIVVSAYRFFVKGVGFLNELSFIVPIFLVAGFVFGQLTWRISENNYRKSSSVHPRRNE